MSSYVLGVEKYQKLATYLNGIIFQNESWGLPPELLAFRGNNKDYWDSNRMDRLCRALYRMNINATNVRYRWEDEKYFAGEYAIQSRRVKPTAKQFIEVIRFIDCALYQCNEGDYGNKKFYQSMKRLHDFLCVYFFSYTNEPMDKSLFDQHTEWGELS